MGSKLLSMQSSFLRRGRKRDIIASLSLSEKHFPGKKKDKLLPPIRVVKIEYEYAICCTRKVFCILFFLEAEYFFSVLAVIFIALQKIKRIPQ